MADKLTKLSAAIRLGSTFRPQCRGRLFRCGGSCVLGAAIEAIIGEFNGNTGLAKNLLRKRFGVKPAILNKIVDKNDRLYHTREQIAEWLEGEGL